MVTLPYYTFCFWRLDVWKRVSSRIFMILKGCGQLSEPHRPSTRTIGIRESCKLLARTPGGTNLGPSFIPPQWKYSQPSAQLLQLPSSRRRQGLNALPLVLLAGKSMGCLGKTSRWVATKITTVVELKIARQVMKSRTVPKWNVASEWIFRRVSLGLTDRSQIDVRSLTVPILARVFADKSTGLATRNFAKPCEETTAGADSRFKLIIPCWAGWY